MSTIRRFGGAIPLLAIGLLLLPSEAWGCAVCFDTTAENRTAFLQTTIALSLLPLGLVGGMGLWLKRRSESMEESEGTDRRENDPTL